MHEFSKVIELVDGTASIWTHAVWLKTLSIVIHNIIHNIQHEILIYNVIYYEYSVLGEITDNFMYFIWLWMFYICYQAHLLFS